MIFNDVPLHYLKHVVIALFLTYNVAGMTEDSDVSFINVNRECE